MVLFSLIFFYFRSKNIDGRTKSTGENLHSLFVEKNYKYESLWHWKNSFLIKVAAYFYSESKSTKIRATSVK